MTISDLIQTIEQTFLNMHPAELWAVITGVLYILLAARENIWCWLFGIISSGLSIYVFFISKLYAESILYFYYILAGFYGWYKWSQKTNSTDHLPVSRWKAKDHMLAVFAGVLLSLSLAWVLRQYTDAQMPLIDAHTTIFSFIATYMTAKKILENWLYWIVIDCVSIWLYWNRDLYLYSVLMLVYTLMAVYAFQNWKKAMSRENPLSSA
jgi:nicotinamide mononucleotide transporter